MPLPSKPARYRWTILAVVWMSYLIVFLGRLSIGPLAPFLKESLRLSNAEVGLLVTATGITYVPTLIAAGWLVDRVGVHRMLVAGTLIGSLCILSVFLAPSYQTIFIIMALSGLGFGCIFPSVVKAIILWFPLKERATALGFNQTAVNVGGIIGASLLPTIALALDWRYGFLFLGLGASMICLCSGILYRDPPQEKLPAASGDTSPRPSPQPSTTRLTIDLFKSRDIWMLSLAGFFLCVAEYATITNLVLYLKEDLLFGVVAAGGLLAMTEAAGAFGKPVSGLASDRLFRGGRKVVFLVMAVTGSIIFTLLGIGVADFRWLLYPILGILGMVTIGWGGLWATLSGELAGKEAAGAASGTSAAISVLGVMAGPPLFGYVVDSTGSFRIAWLTMAACGALAAIFVSLIRERRKRI